MTNPDRNNIEETHRAESNGKAIRKILQTLTDDTGASASENQKQVTDEKMQQTCSGEGKTKTNTKSHLTFQPNEKQSRNGTANAISQRKWKRARLTATSKDTENNQTTTNQDKNKDIDQKGEPNNKVLNTKN